MTERYEEVRRKLVERGYLQGPIERFLLRDLLAVGGPLRAVVRTALKAAIVGAPLLGALLAASVVAANRPLLGGRDAVVLWIYFGVLSAAVLFALDAGAAGLAALLARRRGARGADAIRAGLIVAAPVLVYLIVLQARGRPHGTLAGTLGFLLAAIVASALVAWLAGIVSLAAIVGRTGDVPDRNRRTAAVVVAVLLPIALAFFVIPRGGAASSSSPPSPFTPHPAAGRALVVGVDGLDGALVEAVAPRGAAEGLLGAIARGAMFPTRRTPGIEPAQVWTTIATGMPVEAHGVRGASATRLPGVATPLAVHEAPGGLAALRLLLPGRTVPATGAGRRVRTVWEMASFAEPTAAVGFWATWPARGIEGDATTGYVVTDRVLAKLLSNGREDRDVRPESLFARLAHDFPAQRALWRKAFDARFAALPGETRAVAWESALIDVFSWSTLSHLEDDPAVRAGFVYLPGLDILRHHLAASASAEAASGVVAAQAIETYVRWLDATVFASLASEGPEVRVVIVADPGRSATAGSEGFVAVFGDSARPACVGPTIGDLDVAPLILRVLGLPASREMSGHAPARCFEGAAPPLPRIATWGRRGLPAGNVTSDYDPEMIERLKSLGYVR